jgi:hypothetical protein
MIESKLTEILERAGERTNVGPPPIEAIRAGAARRRRRRAAALSAVGVAAAVVAVGGTMLLAGGPSVTNPAPPAASTPPVPAATRVVGIGHAAIAVPEQWARNQLHCGTPQKDTVIIDAGAQGLCQTPYPDGVESVYVASRMRIDFRADETFQIDGVRAERQRTRCTVDSLSRVTVCSGAVFIPSLNVAFRAESSTSPGEVGRILERITIVPDKVGVPEPQFNAPNQAVRSGEQYAEWLTELGLKPNIQTKNSPGHTPGDTLAVSPSPGTMLTPGATVTVTVVAQP